MAQVKLILREDVDNLGEAGDVVTVKPGYARNYLLPQGKASLATEARVREMEHHRRAIADAQAKALKDLDAARKKIEGQVVEVFAPAGAEGKLFGSVTMQQVADQLTAKGFEVDRRKLVADSVIKNVGEHEVGLRLHREMVARIKVIVRASGAVPEPEAEEPDEDETPTRFTDDD